MRCPLCKSPDSRVVDTRISDDGTVTRRRRQCIVCKKRFSTSESAALMVQKRSGVTEPFSKHKLIQGIRKAFQGRQVTDDCLQILAEEVESNIRSKGYAHIDTYDIGLTVLEPLKKVDQVAYLRFASVYHSFSTLEEFEEEIKTLKSQQSE
ncbi:MAG: transcriptional regulator NrdR [Bifidobacteriaceae bacterium]|jgi:transcriptional repressor NrdR|nr:transcriptional regulator NrdR [Bifidobacteriaceae bacterium]